MFIEDEELRGLYKVSSTEHIETIEASLIQLEKEPADQSTLKALLRAAHSLKGDSRMLGVTDAETLVHQMEEVLFDVEKQAQPLTPQLCDRLYQALDTVRKIAHEAVTGSPAGISVFHAMAELMGAQDDAPESAPGGWETELDNLDLSPNDLDLVPDGLDLTPSLDLAALATDVAADPAAFSEPQDFMALAKTTLSFENGAALKTNGHPSKSADAPTAERFQIETVRVAATQLDALMTQADELAVTKLRIARQEDDLTALLRFWSDWNREAGGAQSTVQALLQQLPTDTRHLFAEQFAAHEQRLAQLGQVVRQLRNTAAADTTRLNTVASEIEDGIRQLRMVPLSSIFNTLPRMVRDLSQQQQKQIEFVVEGGDVLADKRILEEIKDPLTHLLRNAIDHGIELPTDRSRSGKSEKASLKLLGHKSSSQICIEIIDDGRGLDLDAIRNTALRRGLHTQVELEQMSPEQLHSLIFTAGFSTRTEVTELSGRGIGLDVVRANVERLKGSLEVISTPGAGCRFRLTFNNTLAATQAIIVEVADTPYAIPVDAIETLHLVAKDSIFSVDGNFAITWQSETVAIAWLSDLLDLPIASPQSLHEMQSMRKSFPCVMLKVGNHRLGLLVDALLEHQNIVIKPQSKLLQRVKNIMGATILSNGDICMVLQPEDLCRSSASETITVHTQQRLDAQVTQQHILLVEDSLPIRTQMKRILEGAGYHVTAAVDGLDGINKLGNTTFDAVVSDIEMPNLSGLELTEQIRQNADYEDLPIVLVTTLAREEDKLRGAEAGANAYLTKGDFDQHLLLNTLRRLM